MTHERLARNLSFSAESQLSEKFCKPFPTIRPGDPPDEDFHSRYFRAISSLLRVKSAILPERIPGLRHGFSLEQAAGLRSDRS